MSMISEQINKLRKAVKSYRPYVPYYVIGLLHNAADTIESLSAKLKEADCGGGWIKCDKDNLPDKEVLCCDQRGEMILGYVSEDKTSDTGFCAENGVYV